LTAYHPGVTTTWLGGAAIWDAYDKRSLTKVWMRTTRFFSPELLARIRFPIAYLAGVLILLTGILMYRLLGAPLAVVGTLFLAFQPFLLAESRRVHTDALTAEFLFLTLLLWLCYLEDKFRHQRDLVFAGICFGLACLTKSHAGVYLLFLPFMLLWYAKKRGISGAEILMSVLLFCSTTILTVLTVWPYLWTFKLGNLPMLPLLFIGCAAVLLWSWKKLSTQVSFTQTELLILGGSLLLIAAFACYAATYVFERMYGAFTNAHELPKVFLGDIRYNPGLLFYFVIGFVWSAPLTVPFTVLATYGAWKQRFQDKKTFRITIILVLFVLFYFLGLSFVAKKIARYLVICLPAVSLLSAMGCIYIIKLFSNRSVRFVFLIVIVFLQIVPVMRLHPYYLAYHHPLLSGKWITENISVGGGMGLDIAAAYLNQKPDAHNLNVHLSRFSTNLARYFVGNTWRFKKDEIPQDIHIDYEVEYIRGKQIQGAPTDTYSKKGIPSTVLQFQSPFQRELEHIVRLNNVDCVWIYRVLNTRTNDPPSTIQ
ncbi:hypothetical protein F4212_00505, partial [Candidatus Poribacteria bacterium]|nr:hypothetical protein [Candidatus Poribacteria bacterium]